ncbi:MAG: hypothetical protein ACREE0_15320 [Phenylobacterium sp.]
MPETKDARTPCFGVWGANGADQQVWTVRGGLAVRLGVGDPLAMHIFHVPLASADDFESAVLMRLEEFVGPLGWRVEPMELRAGEYYPRMARPTMYRPGERASHHPAARDLRREYVIQMGQVSSLIQKLGEICRFVHPEGPALQAFGHEIRNLLILACTEIETQWRAVLEANGAKARNRHDYVKLQFAMRLGEYAIACNRYPWLEPLHPFADWGRGTTPDLPWYDAYNAVKHHREANFSEGTLEAALNAVAACAIMACAQFGATNPLSAMDGFFSLVDTPSWSFPEVYILADGIAPVEVNYPF